MPNWFENDNFLSDNFAYFSFGSSAAKNTEILIKNLSLIKYWVS
jgi:hypothetical protein